MIDENDENRIISKKAENFLPESNPGYWAKFPNSVPTELRTHNENSIQDVYKLNFGKVSTTNQTKPAQSTAKRVRTAEVWLPVCGGRCAVVVRDAMR